RDLQSEEERLNGDSSRYGAPNRSRSAEEHGGVFRPLNSSRQSRPIGHLSSGKLCRETGDSLAGAGADQPEWRGRSPRSNGVDALLDGAPGRPGYEEVRL